MTDKRGRKNKYGEKNACFRGCECVFSGLRVRAFGVASIFVKGCAYIRAGIYVRTRRPLCIYAQTSVHA